jgi:hypothetical protein
MIDQRVAKDSEEPGLNRIAASLEAVSPRKRSGISGLQNIFCLGAISDSSFKKREITAALISQIGNSFRHSVSIGFVQGIEE